MKSYELISLFRGLLDKKQYAKSILRRSDDSETTTVIKLGTITTNMIICTFATNLFQYDVPDGLLYVLSKM